MSPRPHDVAHHLGPCLRCGHKDPITMPEECVPQKRREWPPAREIWPDADAAGLRDYVRAQWPQLAEALDQEVARKPDGCAAPGEREE